MQTHQLLRFEEEELDDNEVLNIKESSQAAASTLEDLSVDSEVAPFLDQLRSHIESIQNNTLHVKDVSEAIIRTRAALDDAVYRSLDDDQYMGCAG
jgi:CENP-Q, a CENPA-CAD centromere complex subunit